MLRGGPCTQNISKKVLGDPQVTAIDLRQSLRQPKFEIDDPKILKIRKFYEKSMFPRPKSRLKIQNRFVDAKLTLRGVLEVIRKDGLPLGE